MEVKERIISAERFFELMEQPEYLERVIELVEGELIEMSKPTRTTRQSSRRGLTMQKSPFYVERRTTSER